MPSEIDTVILKESARCAVSLLARLVGLNNSTSMKIIAEIKHTNYIEGEAGAAPVEYTTMFSFENGVSEVNSIETKKLRSE